MTSRIPLVACLLAGLGVAGCTTATANSAASPPDQKVAGPAEVTTTQGPVGTVAPPPGPATTLPVPAGDGQLLAALRVAPENDAGSYDRAAFHYPGAGTDARGCDTRARVLQRDSTVPAQVSFPGCKVGGGAWVDSYTGVSYTNPADVTIDHLVPLKEAYLSGTATWSTATLAAFGNDVDRTQSLKVIGGSGNASKGDKDPARWKPPLRSAWPDYARAWLVVKVAYGLTADQAEADALASMLTPSPSTSTAPATTQVQATTPTQPTTPTRATTPTQPTTGSGGVSYANCDAVRAAGAAPLLRGQPGYRAALDRDSDGVACER